MYCKPTDRHSYLQYNSFHPLHLKKSIVFCQILRYKRICSNPHDYVERVGDLLQFFLLKGYPWKLLAKELEKANKFERNTLLAYKEKTNIKRIPIVHQYHPSLIPINKRLQKEWKNLSHNPSFENLFSKPLVCAYKQPPNLKRLLVKSTLPSSVPLHGNQKCRKPRCQVCNILNTQETITPPGTNIMLKPGPFNCDSENVVYLLMCTRCNGGNYVGETKSKFRLRINNHKLSIRNHRNQPGYPVADHYNSRDHSITDLSCILL